MKVLALSAARREPDFSTVFKHLGRYVDLDLMVLDSAAQRHLRSALRGTDLSRYQHILIDLHFRYILRQTGFLGSLPGLLIYEEDACQNYMKRSRWRGRFSRFYRALPNARIVVTGAGVAGRLASEGFDVTFIPKGYDPAMIFVEDSERDIELGFIGRTAGAVYSGRRRILKEIAANEPLRVLRTDPGEPYRNMLNRIRFFISADVGLGEYMSKNFEAMACGCILLAWRQRSEETAMGLEEGAHLLLYSDVTELCGHLARLRSDPAAAQAIADGGRRFVDQHVAYPRLAARLARLLEEPWPAPQQNSDWRDLWLRLKRT